MEAFLLFLAVGHHATVAAGGQLSKGCSKCMFDPCAYTRAARQVAGAPTVGTPLLFLHLHMDQTASLMPSGCSMEAFMQGS